MSEELKQVVYRRNQEYDLFCSDFFYFGQFCLLEDEDIGQLRPFPIQYDFIHNLHKSINDNQATVILKSRRLMVSWYSMLRLLWQAMRAGTTRPTTLDVYRGAVMSIGETEAKYLMERIRKVYHRMPEWIKSRNPIATDNNLFISFVKGGTIQAFPCKREGPQTFGFTEALFDEMALQEAARTTWVGLIPTLGAHGKVFAVSTPNGKFNFFYDLWSNKGKQYDEINRIKLHWRLHPEHDDAWYAQQTAKLDEQAIARMYELSFSHYLGERVFPEFESHHIVPETEVMKNRPMYLGWDFGYHFPALVFAQKNTLDQYVTHREYVDFSVPFHKYVKDSYDFCNSFFNPKKQSLIHCVDVAGFQSYHSTSESGARNDIEEIRKIYGRESQIRKGSIDVGTRDNEGSRIKAVRKVLALREDHRSSLLVNNQCEWLIDGFNGGYSYPEKGGDQPLKNEYSHTQDCLQAIVTADAKMFRKTDKEKKKTKYNRIGGRIGL